MLNQRSLKWNLGQKKMIKINYLSLTFSQDVITGKIRLGYEKTSIFIKDFKFFIFGFIGLILVYI